MYREIAVPLSRMGVPVLRDCNPPARLALSNQVCQVLVTEIADPPHPSTLKRHLPAGLTHKRATLAPMLTEKARRVAHFNPKGPKSGRPLFWAYGMADLAELYGITLEALRAQVAREGHGLNPYVLESVCQEWARRQK